MFYVVQGYILAERYLITGGCCDSERELLDCSLRIKPDVMFEELREAQ